MNAEREKEAREHRSQGQELAEGIRAAADREVTVLKANAYRDAELLRGEPGPGVLLLHPQPEGLPGRLPWLR
jgi:regulator of protease activity HflC (stomatin/prohibitin superfamily)